MQEQQQGQEGRPQQQWQDQQGQPPLTPLQPLLPLPLHQLQLLLSQPQLPLEAALLIPSPQLLANQQAVQVVAAVPQLAEAGTALDLLPPLLHQPQPLPPLLLQPSLPQQLQHQQLAALVSTLLALHSGLQSQLLLQHQHLLQGQLLLLLQPPPHAQLLQLHPFLLIPSHLQLLLPLLLLLQQLLQETMTLQDGGQHPAAAAVLAVLVSWPLPLLKRVAVAAMPLIPLLDCNAARDRSCTQKQRQGGSGPLNLMDATTVTDEVQAMTAVVNT